MWTSLVECEPTPAVKYSQRSLKDAYSASSTYFKAGVGP